MKTLVTGGGGFLGLYVTEQLVSRGTPVRVLTRGNYPRLNELGVETVHGDLRDAAAVAKACAGCDTVFHVAAVPGIWGPWRQYYEINTLGTQHVIAGCLSNGITRLIYTSTPSVVYDGRPHVNANEDCPYTTAFLCNYPKSKVLAEQAVLAANGQRGLATVALRPHLIWGPRDNHLIPRLIRRARSGRLRQVGDGENLISVSYVENVAAAHLEAASGLQSTSPAAGKAYFINDPEPVRLWSWVNDLLARAGLSPVRKRISAGGAYRLGACLEGIYTLLRLPGEPPMTRFLASQLSNTHYYDISRARQDFGYTPLVTVEEGLRRLDPELQQWATA